METTIAQQIEKELQKKLSAPSPYTPSYHAKIQEAFKKFKASGLPTKKNEDWMYSLLSKNLHYRFIDKNEDPIHLPDVEPIVIDKKQVLVFINGIFQPEYSQLPIEMSKSPPVECDDFSNGLDAINFIQANTAWTFTLSPKAVLETPLTILHLTDVNGVNKHLTSRVTINLGAFSQLSLLEYFGSTQNSLLQYTQNAHVSFNLDENSQLTHVALIEEAKAANHYSAIKANLKKSAELQSTIIHFGCLHSRNNIDISLREENAHVDLMAGSFFRNTEANDLFTLIRHQRNHTTSHQLVKNLIGGSATSAFSGKIIIDPQCDLVNAEQLNNNLLLSPKAHLFSRPQLLVGNDNVKCSHGATVGNISPEEEFYLVSRGLTKERARRLLAFGFINSIIYKIKDQKIQKLILKKCDELDFSI